MQPLFFIAIKSGYGILLAINIKTTIKLNGWVEKIESRGSKNCLSIKHKIMSLKSCSKADQSADWHLFRKSVGEKFFGSDAKVTWWTHAYLVPGEFKVSCANDEWFMSAWNSVEGPVARLTVGEGRSVFAPDAEAAEIYNKLVAGFPGKEYLKLQKW